MTIKNELSNGTIKQFRDKYDNAHLNSLYDIELGNNTFGRHEIYSVENKNNEILTIGDSTENGIISDFFIVNNNIHVRYNTIIMKESNIKIKKTCNKL